MPGHPIQASLVQVCESTEITYDKNVVNFQVTISSVPAVYRRCVQSIHSSMLEQIHRTARAALLLDE
jgi:hypothetical protein